MEELIFKAYYQLKIGKRKTKKQVLEEMSFLEWLATLVFIIFSSALASLAILPFIDKLHSYSLPTVIVLFLFIPELFFIWILSKKRDKVFYFNQRNRVIDDIHNVKDALSKDDIKNASQIKQMRDWCDSQISKTEIREQNLEKSIEKYLQLFFLPFFTGIIILAFNSKTNQLGNGLQLLATSLIGFICYIVSRAAIQSFGETSKIRYVYLCSFKDTLNGILLMSDSQDTLILDD